MLPTTEALRAAQILSLGQYVQDTYVPAVYAPNGPPADDAGVDLRAYRYPPIVAFCGGTLSYNPAAIDSVVRILQSVNGEQYTIAYDGVSYTHTATLAQTTAQIAQALLDLVPTGTASDATRVENEVRFRGRVGQAYTVGVLQSAPDLLEAGQSATTWSFRLWGRYPGRGWKVVPDSQFDDLTTGLCERFTVAGLERVYVEILTCDGAVRPAVLPGVSG